MIAALLAKPHHIDFRGERVVIKRPRVADLVACVDASERGTYMPAWFVLNHVLDGDHPAFESLEQVMQLDGPAVVELSREIEKLYVEGLDLSGPHAKS
jgi:hypothetical protein